MHPRGVPFNTPAPNFARDSEQHAEMKQIAAFLNAQEWHLASSHEQKGISWTELLMLYEMSGFRYTQTKEGIAEDLKRAKEQRGPAAMRWTDFLPVGEDTDRHVFSWQ